VIQRDTVGRRPGKIVDPTVLDGSGSRRVNALSSWMLATAGCSIALLFFLLTTDRMWHWFVIPVLVSGVIVARDAVEWFRGNLETIDPLGLFALFGLHFFFIAYLLHVALDFYWHYGFPPPDWRPWLGLSAIVNVVGLLLFRWLLRLQPKRAPRTVWVLHRGRFLAVTGVALVVSAVFQFFFYSRLGGIVEALYARETRTHGFDPFQGLGWAIAIAESFPVILVIALLVFTRRARFWQTRMAVPTLLVGALVIALLFGGVRGSRSTIFVVLFWAVVLLHVYIRPISRKLVLIGPILLFLFMSGYMFYKHGGVKGVARIGDTQVIRDIEDRIGFGNAYAFIVLHDFARADSQALVLYLDATDDSYSYALGRTFYAGLMSVVPRAIWPNRPENLNREKAHLMYGIGSTRRVTWIFGFPGEFLLNFGPIAMPLAFVVLAVVVILARFTLSWRALGDSRLFLWPLLLYMCFVTLLVETQVFLWMLVKNGLVPFAVVAASSVRLRRSDPSLRGSAGAAAVTDADPDASAP
jgi:hypothetical protein